MYNVKDGDIRANQKNFHNSTDGQFGRVWNYHCKDHSIDECFKPAFFASIRSNLMASDVIRLIRMIKGNAVAYCEGMVLQVTDKDVDFRMISDSIIYFQYRKDFEKEIIEIKKESPPAYIQGEGKINYNPGRKMFIIKVGGEMVAEAADKDTAERIVRGDMPIPIIKNRGLGDTETEEKSFREPTEHHQV
jgi:hypothetical protein